jgi:hypothetical protein
MEWEQRIDMRDRYPCSPPQVRPVDLRAPREGGLGRVRAGTRWGVVEFDDGKYVWAVLSVRSAVPVPAAG